jgi:hypothetical protein
MAVLIIIQYVQWNGVDIEPKKTKHLFINN